MKRLFTILSIISLLAAAYSCIRLFTSDLWIEHALMLALSLSFTIIFSCLGMHCVKESKIGWPLGLFTLALSIITLIAFLDSSYISQLWNYQIGGLITLIGYTLINLLKPSRIYKLIMMISSLILAMLFILKIQGAYSLSILYTFGIILSASTVIALFQVKR